MTLPSRFIDDPLYREKVSEKDRQDDGRCPDCGEIVPGFVCRPCWQRNHPGVRFNPLSTDPAAVPPW